MNIHHKHLCFTYGNYRCDFSNYSSYSNHCDFNKSQIKKKDNRPTSHTAVIF